MPFASCLLPCLTIVVTSQPIPDSRFPIPDSRFPIPDSRFPIPDSRLNFTVESTSVLPDDTQQSFWLVAKEYK
ncbi:hypothetical protein [Moorena bouillonii]|uniref:hypothetical protein n=1 Tax=Moorena bouillonii TaxID=207920 RepID=UPI00117D797A|nr:hypothetical protein [Moorena bouillonii]